MKVTFVWIQTSFYPRNRILVDECCSNICVGRIPQMKPRWFLRLFKDCGLSLSIKLTSDLLFEHKHLCGDAEASPVFMWSDNTANILWWCLLSFHPWRMSEQWSASVDWWETSAEIRGRRRLQETSLLSHFCRQQTARHHWVRSNVHCGKFWAKTREWRVGSSFGVSPTSN